MARRNIKIDLRLNEQEMERLRRDVARSGWSREKYLRALIEHSVIKEMPSIRKHGKDAFTGNCKYIAAEKGSRIIGRKWENRIIPI